MSSREEVLARIRAATVDVPADEPVAWDPDRDRDAASAYARARPAPADIRAARFAARVREHGARVDDVANQPGAIADAVAIACQRHGIGSAVVPADFPAAWVPGGIHCVVDEPPVPLAALSTAEAVLTAAALAVGDTGTIVLDGGAAQGRRVLTLVPDLHICVVRAEQVVPTVPEAVRALAEAARAGRQLTLVSGPSATSDIGFERVVGVHGPRTLEVLLVHGDAASPSKGG